VSLSPTLDRNEKVDQHIRKKTRKLNALRFWVEGGVIPLYIGSVLILVRSPRLGRNEKVEQHIRKKTHKLNVVSFPPQILPTFHIAQSW